MDIVERLMRQIEIGPNVEDIVFINPDGPDAVDEIERLDSEIERLREALKYYADVKNWKLILESNKNYSVEIDGGQIARSALQQKESE